MSARTALVAGGAALLLAASFLAAYPAWLQSRAAGRARADGCEGGGPPSAGFFAAIRDDERVAAFPGFGHSDVIAAEAVFCVGTYAQACLAVANAAPAARRETCERWAEFARWYSSTGPKAPAVCPACAGPP